MNRPNNRHALLPFVRDGYQRALDGIRKEIEAKYAAELENATDADRPLVVKRTESEIDAAVKRLASPSALW
jgi:hypothetical protein